MSKDVNIAGWRCAPSFPENPTPLQIFKEPMPATIRVVVKSVCYTFYQFLPVKAFSSSGSSPRDDQRLPNVTKDYRILNFQPVIHPKPYLFFTFSIPKFNSGAGGLVKPVVVRSFSGFAEGPDGRCSAPSPSEP
jgi:hypothetical protein